MSVHTVFPVLDQQLSSEFGQRKLLFDELDAQARTIEFRWKSTWVELADICETVDSNQLWREGGYASFGAWITNACPTSRSMAYMALGLRKELKEFSAEDLKQIPLGNAEILKNTPRQNRTSELLAAAKEQPPREFERTVIDAAPAGHLERTQCHKFRLTAEASKNLQRSLDMWRFLNDDPKATAIEAFEGMFTDYMLSHQREFEQKVANR